MIANAIERAAEIVGNKAVLSRAVGVQPPTLQQWIKGTRPIPIQKCNAIERATDGQVTRKDLRPDDWHLIWPELAQKEEVA